MTQTIRLIVYVVGCFLAYQIFAFVSQGTHPWVLYNADALNIPLLYESIVHGQGTFSDWTVPSTTYFFPDISVYFLLGVIIKNRFLHVIAFGVVQILYFVFILDVLGRIVTGNKRVSLFPLIALFSLALLSTGVLTNSLLITLVVSNFHMGATLMTFTLWALLLSVIKKDHWWKKISLLVLAYATAWSDVTFLYDFLLPALATLILLGIVRQLPKRVAWQYSGILLLVIALSQYFLHNNKPLRIAAPPISLHANWQHVLYYVDSLRMLYQNNSILFCTLIAVILVGITTVVRHVLQRKPINLCIVLLCASVLTFFIGSVVVSASDYMLANGANPLLGRHIQTTLLFPVLCGLPALVYYHAPKMCWSNFSLILVIVSIAILSIAFSYPMNRHNLLSFHPPYIACLDKLNHRYTLQGGLTAYRDAKPIRFLSQTGIQTVAYDELHHTPQLWMNSIAWYHNRDVNFIVWRRDIPNPPPLRPSIMSQVGYFYKHLTCGSYDIWLYKSTQLGSLIKNANYQPIGPVDATGIYTLHNTLLRAKTAE